jgi:hypothetical protein
MKATCDVFLLRKALQKTFQQAAYFVGRFVGSFFLAVHQRLGPMIEAHFIRVPPRIV